MTEEEKKAIEKIKELEKLSREESKERNLKETQKLYKEYADYYLIILNLIDKLKKENEELKEDNLGIREENIKLVNCHISYERYTGLDFLLPDKFKYAIPKDKIREAKQYLEYYLIGNLEYENCQNEFKKILKLLKEE